MFNSGREDLHARPRAPGAPVPAVASAAATSSRPQVHRCGHCTVLHVRVYIPIHREDDDVHSAVHEAVSRRVALWICVLKMPHRNRTSAIFVTAFDILNLHLIELPCCLAYESRVNIALFLAGAMTGGMLLLLVT